MGPAGVRPEARRMGLMLALEIMSLKAMREKGYRYAVSGRVHPWVQKMEKEVAGGVPIPASGGSYHDMI